MATTRQTELDVSTDAPLWIFGEEAAKRAEEASSTTCEHGVEPEDDGEILCWDCFKDELEHFPIEEESEDD